MKRINIFLLFFCLFSKPEEQFCQYNSFLYWRTPLPAIDLSDIQNLDGETPSETKTPPRTDIMETEMETWSVVSWLYMYSQETCFHLDSGFFAWKKTKHASAFLKKQHYVSLQKEVWVVQVDGIITVGYLIVSCLKVYSLGYDVWKECLKTWRQAKRRLQKIRGLGCS